MGDYPFAYPSPFVRTSISLPLTRAERKVFFNCQEPLARCRFFLVGDFFQSIRKKFTYDELIRFGIAENPNLPAITTLEWWFPATTGTRTVDQGSLDLPPSISFVHVHKCGGSTVHAVLRQVRDQLQHGRDSLHAQVSTFK